MEIWRDVPNYEGYYQVSSLGNVKSMDRTVRSGRGNHVYVCKGRLKKSSVARNGYSVVSLSRGGKTTSASIHTMVMMAFEGPPKDKWEVHHRDGNRQNNRLENLEYVLVFLHRSLHSVGNTRRHDYAMACIQSS